MTDVEDRVEQALHVLAECHEPDVAAARSRLASRAGSAVRLSRRRVRPRVWVTLAAATVAIVGVGALWAVGRPSEPPAAQTDPPLAPSVEPPTTSSVELPTTTAAAPPTVPTPQRLAVLDPQPGASPIRSDPVLDWIHGTTSTAPRRWFVRRSADGTPAGGISITESTAMEWSTTFVDAPSAGIAGVDARVVVTPLSAQVAWLTERGMRVVSGIGDVDAEEAVAVADSTASTEELAEIVVPAGFEEVSVPTEQGSVRYEDTQLTIGFSAVGPGEIVDAAAAAFMAPGRDGPLTPLSGQHEAWVTTSFGGHPTAVVAVDTDAVAMVVGLPGTDLTSLIGALAVVPARDVAIGNPEVTHGIPADATKTYGEIERGRWVVYEYSTIHGTECLSIDASWGGSGDCSPSGMSDCPVANPTGGPNAPSGYEVFVPYHAEDIAVTLDGVPAEITIEHDQGFTFAYGPAPSGHPTIEVTIGGQPAC